MSLITERTPDGDYRVRETDRDHPDCGLIGFVARRGSLWRIARLDSRHMDGRCRYHSPAHDGGRIVAENPDRVLDDVRATAYPTRRAAVEALAAELP